MKIKLNSSSEIARKIAMCFVGNRVSMSKAVKKRIGDTRTLVGVHGDSFVVKNDSIDCPEFEVDTIIDLSTVEFDIFAACREGVHLRWEVHNGVELFSKSGIIETVGATSVFRFEDGACSTVSQEYIKLDTEHYRNIEGIEVVE